jgi:DNA topoisomerase-1
LRRLFHNKIDIYLQFINTMMMKLLIVESPAKAKTISKYLDGEYTVVASVGHIRDLPKSNKKAIDIEHGFTPHYEISKGKEKVVADIKKLAAKADEILLATDPDREGEAIAWHIAQAVGIKKPKRVVFHEITKDAVVEAVKHPREIDENLKEAQEARRVLDRLVGYDLSGIIWKKVRYGLSAGRVQSPALRIVMEREREIRAFVSHVFWVITADVKNKKNFQFTLNCEVEPTDKKEVEKILEIGKSSDWIVKDIKESDVKKAPRPPFITSTLQQAASTRLGFAPSRTMGLAQKLYEEGHITYMRTDSTTLSKVALAQIATVVEKEYGKDYLQFRTFASKSKNAQEAHEAIRPTHIEKNVAGKNSDEEKLYNLIWARTVASQMKDAQTLRTKITVEVDGGKSPDFSVNGSRVTYDGWMKADPASRGDDVQVPEVEPNEKLNLLEIHTEEKNTEPPNRYSEAGLVKELEKRGIGRPSTYASIIKTIEERGYVEKVNKALVPTDTGDVVSSFLEDNFMEYINDDFTAEMEDKLDLIAEGKHTYVDTLTKFYKPFLAHVKIKDKLDKATTLGVADSKFKCPICGSGMVIKLGKGGKFLSCDRYPDCEGALTLEGVEIKKDEPIGNDPETGLPIFVMTGRFGPYVQMGERVKGKGSKSAKKPKMSSIPKEKDLSTLTLKDALTYLSLPRVLGVHPVTGSPISANNGRFGPYVVHEKDFRSLKTDDVYTIELPRALEIFAEEKKRRGFKKKVIEGEVDKK